MDGGRGRQVQAERWAALSALEERVQSAPAAAGWVHAGLLRDLMELAGGYAAQGQSLSVSPQVALLLRCSGAKADRLLGEAAVLLELPDGLAALEQGVLTVEQCAVVAVELGRVPDLATRLPVWRRLLARLQADLAAGAVLPGPRLRELLRRWVLELAPKDAQEQRDDAAAERRVEYRRRQDGLTDILLFGVESTLAHAVLHRVRAESAPVGVFDERTADQRRLDAAVDLLLARASQPPSCPDGPCPVRHGSDGHGSDGHGQDELGVQVSPACSGAWCGCLPGTPVPCGTQLLVHVPLGAALGTTGEVAELVGHGPVEPEVLQQLLLTAPVLRAVHVDAAGVPVAVSDQTYQPQRRNPQAVRSALLTLAAQPPGDLQPRHPDDHRHHDQRRPTGPTAPTALGAAHPLDRPGPYRPSPGLRRLIEARAPRCEFPGCGARAVVCDAEHDRAWPDGPTCACNLGPCCRRHHRTKQEGWTKQRLQHSAVRWTSPTGRAWTSPPQHPAPTPALRPLRAVPTANPWDELDPVTVERLLWELDDRPDDPTGLELRGLDVDPDGQDPPDRLGDLLSSPASRWSTDLDDAYAWLPDTSALLSHGAQDRRTSTRNRRQEPARLIGCRSGRPVP